FEGRLAWRSVHAGAAAQRKDGGAPGRRAEPAEGIVRFASSVSDERRAAALLRPRVCVLGPTVDFGHVVLTSMDVTIARIAAEHIEGFHHALDVVARERARYCGRQHRMN